MIDLSSAAGIVARVDPRSAELELGEGLAVEEVAVRTLDAARDVYESPPAEAPPLYHMLNGITPHMRSEPASALRLELTALRPGTVGHEWVKTIGHVHEAAADGLGYPETYEVVAGTAVFVLFRWEQCGETPEEVLCLLIEAERGERFVIPPGWHHLAINSGSEAMVFADVVARAVVPDYSLVRGRQGAPLYLGPDGAWCNPRFASGAVVRLRCAELPVPEHRGQLAEAFFEERSALDYLLRPADYAELWRAFDAVVGAAPLHDLDHFDAAGSG